MKSNLNSLRDKLKTQDYKLRNTTSSITQISQLRNKTQANNKFAFKPKLSLYATNNSFMSTERGNPSSIQYRMQLKSPKSSIIGNEHTLPATVSQTKTTDISTPA